MLRGKQKIKTAALLGVASILTVGLFLYPRASATVPGVSALASVDSSGNQSNNTSSSPSISGDGRYVAFQSAATNLVSGDTNGYYDIFVRDTVSGTTVRANVSSAGAQATGGPSSSARISYDGRYVVFESGATNLVSSDTNGQDDVFVHDMQTGTTSLASVKANGTQEDATGASPDISADGRYVTFQSAATNLVSGVSGYGVGSQIYLKDMVTGALEALSVTSGGSGGNSYSASSRISCDGNVVTFVSNATNLVTGGSSGSQDILVDALGWSGNKLSDITQTANGSSDIPTVSCNGNEVAYMTDASNIVSGTPSSTRNVIVYSRLTGQSTVASVDASGSYANGSNQSPAISDDGQYVAFRATSNLTTQDSNGTDDVYIRDLKNSTTQLVSVNPSNNHAVGWAQQPAISQDGSHVAYYTSAEDSTADGSPIVTGDTNGHPDIYTSETGF